MTVLSEDYPEGAHRSPRGCNPQGNQRRLGRTWPRGAVAFPRSSHPRFPRAWELEGWEGVGKLLKLKSEWRVEKTFPLEG